MALTKEQVFEKAKAIIIDQLGVEEDEVTREASFIDDLGCDSLDLVELIMAAEEEADSVVLGFEVPEDEAEKLTTVGAAVDYFCERLGIQG